MSSITSIKGKSGIKRSNRKNDNEAKKLKALFSSLPEIAVKSVIRAMYPIIVAETVQDSGKAAYNWWIGKGKAQRRFYVEENNLGPIGFSGEKRTDTKAARTVIGSRLPVGLIVGLKVAYMEKFLTSNNLTTGATIYNQTPVKTKSTSKGTYEGNAKIRVAVAKAMVEAEGAIDMALRKFS